MAAILPIGPLQSRSCIPRSPQVTYSYPAAQKCVLQEGWSTQNARHLFSFQPEQASKHGSTAASYPRVVSSLSSAGRDAPPSSKEDAIHQAAASLAALLGRSLKSRASPGPRRGKKQSSEGQRSSKQQKLQVEIPVMDDGAEASVELAALLLDSLLVGKGGDERKIAVIFSSTTAAERALVSPFFSSSSRANFDVWHLEDPPTILSGCSALFLVAPSRQQQGAVEATLRAAEGSPHFVLINPQWAGETENVNEAFLSFEVCYCFLPLSLKGIFGTSEGAVLKIVRGGAPSGTPWIVFREEGSKLKQLTTCKSRPNQEQIETIMYASMAANSPVTKSVQFVKALFGSRSSQ